MASSVLAQSLSGPEGDFGARDALCKPWLGLDTHAQTCIQST